MTNQGLLLIADFLAEWGVRAVCIAGGGEPTLHPGLNDFMDSLLRYNIRYGIVTNGTNIDEHQQMLMFADWVGVSIDAGKDSTYRKLKKAGTFYDVLEQCRALINFVSGTTRPLARPGLGNGVFWKFLVHPDNISDMEIATKRAKDIGFKAIHFRPVGQAWNELGNKQDMRFTRRDIKKFNNNLTKLAMYESPDFAVYGVTHKFNKDFKPKHCFDLCRAVFMTTVFQPPTRQDEFDGFNLGLCCDRRGDLRTTVLNVPNPEWLKDFWGSERHWNLANEINPHKDCPRCTYAPHNEIFEQVVENDNMTHEFI
jgi:MoaA/NifB/PqqE/SkfB family radical SAM enzyme